MRKILKVMLHPGEVTSKNDDDRHHIGARQLASLYGVLPTDEVVIYDSHNPTHSEEYLKRHHITCLHLYPRYDGDYCDIHKDDEILALIRKQ